jgi:site-specific DNA-methyltransferase (adenine-specific)
MSTPYYSDAAVTLYHGDCRALLPALDHRVDSLITDPPYGLNVGYGRTKFGTRRIDGDADMSLILGVFKATAHLMVPDAWTATFCGYSQVGEVQMATEASGYKVKTVIVWDKAMPSLGMGIRNQHEMVVLAKQGRPVEPFMGGNVWRILRERGTPQHPHMKPQALMSRLIDYYSPEGGMVLDPFAGSGSTLVAAKQLGRTAIGIEIDESYCELIAKRLDQGVLDFGATA